MNTFALDKNYSRLNFDEISVDELEIISGGTGLANVNDGLYAGGAGMGYWPSRSIWMSPSTAIFIPGTSYSTGGTTSSGNTSSYRYGTFG